MDRVAIVTGATSGIGRATAIRLAGDGAEVIAIGRSSAALDELAATQGNIHPVQLDLSDHDAIPQCVGDVMRRFQRIDILVNNAGISFYSRMMDSSLEELRKTLSVNFEAMYVLAKEVVPHMIQRRYGRIVNVSSVQAVASEPTVGAYAASKGAICAWSRSLAVDLAEYGILVNVVMPGCIHTGMSIINGVDETQTDVFKQWYVGQRKIPLARAGKSEEVACAIAFLSGDQCTYMTGSTLVVDGGLTITF